MVVVEGREQKDVFLQRAPPDQHAITTDVHDLAILLVDNYSFVHAEVSSSIYVPMVRKSVV